MVAAGCGLEGPIPRAPKHDEPVVNKAAESKVDAKGSGADPKASERAAGSGRIPKTGWQRRGAAKTSGETKPGVVREKAAVGAGEKGRGYGGDMVTMPLG